MLHLIENGSILHYLFPNDGFYLTIKIIPMGQRQIIYSLNYGSLEGAVAAFAENIPKAISILIAEDHDLIRKSLNRLLSIEPDIIIVGEAKNGIEAVDMAEKLHPDLILMDINMPGMDGITATRIIRQSSSETKIIGLSMHLVEDMQEALMDAGADAYISKTVSRTRLLETIRSIPDFK